jgi:hypothetical protein
MATTPYTTFFGSASVTSTAAGDDADLVYEVPANHDCEVDFCVATNGGSTSKISIQVYHADDAGYHYVLREHSVAGNDTYKIVGSDRIYLHAGDKIVAFKGSGTFDVSVSGRQFYNPVRVS